MLKLLTDYKTLYLLLLYLCLYFLGKKSHNSMEVLGYYHQAFHNQWMQGSISSSVVRKKHSFIKHIIDCVGMQICLLEIWRKKKVWWCLAVKLDAGCLII